MNKLLLPCDCSEDEFDPLLENQIELIVVRIKPATNYQQFTKQTHLDESVTTRERRFALSADAGKKRSTDKSD